MVKILHLADFHLDSPMDALPPAKATERRAELRETIMRAVQLANETGVQIILIPGDLFDGASVFYETAEAVSRELAKARARVFIAPGNHDYYAPGSIYTSIRWSDNVHVFTSQKIERVQVPELGLSVYGAAFTAPACDMGLLRGFRADPDDISIMVMHGDVGQLNSRYNPIGIIDIQESGLDYLALGHVHAFSGIQRVGTTAYAYPGCIEGRGFDELGDKGAIVGIVSKGNSEFTFLPLARRRYLSLDLNITGLAKAEIVERIINGFGHGSERDIVRIILKGEQEMNDAVSVDIENEVRDAFYHVLVHDETRIKQDLWQDSDSDTLRGQFLRRMKEELDKAQDDARREEIELAVRFGIAAIEKRELSDGI